MYAMQLAVYPAGIHARYERHRDAYPDDGFQTDDGDDDDTDQSTRGGHSDEEVGMEKLEGGGEQEHSAKHDNDAIKGGEEEGGEKKEGAELRTDRRGGVGGGEVIESGSVSFRRITAICYLRGDGSAWKASDGGALRLYPPARTGDVGGGGTVPGAGQGGRVTFNISFGDCSGGDSCISDDAASSGVMKKQPCGCGNSRSGSGGWGDIGTTMTPGDLPCCSCGSLNGSVEGSPNAATNIVSDGSPSGVVSGNLHGEDDLASISGGGGCSDGGGEGFIDVAPLAGRAVVFFSGAVEHEVLPLTGALPRAALTTWFH